MLLKARFLFPFLLLLVAFQSFGQISFDSQEELEKAANGFFESEDYVKAKPLFSQLLSKDALDPDYNYRFGVCIMFTEADPLKPLPYIEGGANSPGVNNEAYYYLGKIYQFNYRFDDAVKAYEKGKASGFRSPKIDLDRSIEECRNGKILYNSAIDFQPDMDKEVLASEFYRPYDFRKLKGKVIPMPPNFKTKYDQKNLVGTVIYTPMNSGVLVYASYGEEGANAKDLYRVNRLPNGEWAIPQRLPDVINTKYDEDYAFYDEESQTLFFASKGHNTMGGYDVFSSKYNPTANTWSTPMNLQFPVNSPFDDFLYVSDPEGNLAFFTSGRNTETGKLRVFKMPVQDPDQMDVSVLEGMFEDLTDSVYNYAALTVVDPSTNEIVGKYRSQKTSGKYLLILPPRNDYRLDVGPKEANGFNFDLDVPKSESLSTLKQQLTYSSANDQATVSMTNFFDAAGRPDTIKFAESRSLKEVAEQMVEMPELPAEQLAQAKPMEEEQKSEQLALAKEQAKEDSIRKVEELATATEKARQDSIQKAEQRALEQKKADEAKQDSIKQAEALAQEKARQEELAAQAEKEKAAKARLDSLKAVEAANLVMLQKKAAEAKQAMLLDSLRKAEEMAFEKQRLETAKREKQKAQEDSIQQAQQLVLEQEKAQQVQEDSLKEAQALAEEIAREEESIANETVEQARLDSLKHVELVAAHEKAREDFIYKAEQLLEQQKNGQSERDSLTQPDALVENVQQDSIQKVEQLAIKQKKAEEVRLDSLRRVELLVAREKAEKDSIQKLEQLAIEQEKVEQARLDSLKHVELVAAHEKAREDFVFKAEQLAEEYKRSKQEQKDSIELATNAPTDSIVVPDEEAALAMELKDQEAAMLEETETAQSRQKAEEDSSVAIQNQRKKAVADSTAEAERLAEIDREVELAKQRALRDSMIVEEVAVVKEETDTKKDTYSEILKEMAAKEAEILKQQASEKSDALPAGSLAVSDTSKKVDENEAEIALDKVEVVSESELFLQTITKMEQQKKEQEALVSAENQAREEAKIKAKTERDLKQLEAAKTVGELSKGEIDSALAVTGQGIAEAKMDSGSVEVDGPLDGELESIALKSDADPNAYLAALNEIEAEMEVESKSRPDKDYTLRSMEELQARSGDINVDPVLQEKIDADRKALELHQQEARVKEEALKAQMQQDREVVESYEGELADELLEAENAVVHDETQPKEELQSVTKNEFLTTKGGKKVELEPTAVAVEEVAAAEEEWAEEPELVTEQPQQAVETTETPVEKEFVEVEGSSQVIEQEKDALIEELAEIDAVQPEENGMVEEEVVMMEPEITPKDRVGLEAEVLETESQPEVKQPEPVIEIASEEIEEEIAVIQEEEVTTENEAGPVQAVNTLDAPQPASVGTVGTIPFLTAAKRDYSISKPSFDRVENPDVRKMIKRMRAEDIGRLAVLKNMKNEWIQAGKTQEALNGIKDNRRNQDVLANQTSHSREEYIRPPFNRDDLRKRKDVYYKLEFVLEPTGVSNNVSKVMSAESAIIFSMPTVQLSAGFFLTLADVRAEMKEYQNRGFETLRIVPFMNDTQVTLSDVQDAPFVD